MRGTIERLEMHLESILQLCAGNRNGEFRIESCRSRETVSIRIPGTPSNEFHATEDELELLAVRFQDGPPIQPRSIVEVRRLILFRLHDIAENSNGNGNVEVFCRRQENGRLRIRIRQRNDDEVVLRPDEY